MEYVNLGGTGIRVSRVCLGMMSFGNNSQRPGVLAEDAAATPATASTTSKSAGP